MLGHGAKLSKLVLLAALAAASGCVHARDFRSPLERTTPDSAYAEVARVRLDGDLLVPDSQKFVANLGLSVAAIRGRLDVSANLAHALIGALSLGSKFTIFDGRFYALGGRVGLSYLDPRTLWFLPAELREPLGAIRLVSVPLELWNSFPVTPWLGLHLGLGYRAGSITGAFDGDALLVDANLARRAFTLAPKLELIVARRVALTASARLPVFAQVIEASDVQVEVEPGLIVGVRSVEWIRRSLANTYQLEFGAEARLGRATHLRAGVSVHGFRPIPQLRVAPFLSLYWRFF